MYSQPFFLNPAEITTQEQSAVYVLGDMFADYPFLVSGNNSFSPEGPILKICYSILSKLNIFNILDWADFANNNNLETHWQLIGGDMGWGAITPEEKQLATNFILDNYKQFKLNQKQLVTILNYAKNTIPKLSFSEAERAQFIFKLVQLCKNRKLTANTVSKLLGPWHTLQEIINLQLP
jgi:hypothetical protein